MKLIKTGGKGKQKKTYLNLDTLTKIDLLQNGDLQLTWARYFDVLTEGDPGYQEVVKMIEKESKEYEGNS